MSFDQACEQMRSGKTVTINGWKYRMVRGSIERLNGWWQVCTWPITEEEKASKEWEVQD